MRRLTATQADTLRVLVGAEPRTAAAVAYQFSVSYSTAYGRLERLGDRGLVDWWPRWGSEEREGYVLTAAGHDALARYDAEQVP